MERGGGGCAAADLAIKSLAEQRRERKYVGKKKSERQGRPKTQKKASIGSADWVKASLASCRRRKEKRAGRLGREEARRL